MTSEDHHRFPFGPLRRRCGVTIADAARTLNISHASATKHEQRGLSGAVADVLCTSIGLHPTEVWTDWFDHADDPLHGRTANRKVRGDVPTLALCTEVVACPICGAAVDFVAAGAPTDRGRRSVTAVVCAHGHRHTVTVTIDAA